MADADSFRLVDITPAFLESFAAKDFTTADRRAIRRALIRLDDDEQHPSLRVHQLTGDLQGSWSASASDSLRIVFVRLPNGRRSVVRCSKHYDR